VAGGKEEKGQQKVIKEKRREEKINKIELIRRYVIGKIKKSNRRNR